MIQLLSKAAYITTLTTVMVSISLLPLFAASPSLDDGIICIAKKKEGRGKVYFYTSLIDGNTFNKKQPVSVTMLETQSEVTTSDLLILDKKKQSVSVTNIESESITNPELEPVAIAKTNLTDNNEFKGQTQTGTPVTFKLKNNYSKWQLTHAGQTYSGVCH
ncbi:hypothetical protein [Scytonema sp. NUACC26]|uniref:hypothetical protein n=1 Tax=Scytonema sp. NUACC26 TaxID=3140176 RepID=UPI0034DC6E22